MFNNGLYCCCGLDTDYSDYNHFIVFNDILSFNHVDIVSKPQQQYKPLLNIKLTLYK